jgi:choline kinase
MVKAGIRKVKIVVSEIFNKFKYKRRILKSVALSRKDSYNVELDIIENKYPSRENGYSLFLGLNTISSNYILLSMADHIFSKNIFSQLLMHYTGNDILLATDPMHSKGYYDLGDATKVYGKNSSIMDIGKNLTYYNRLDMGVFILKSKKIKKICQRIKSNLFKFGVTNVVLSGLNSDLNVGYQDFPNTLWLDIDDYKIYLQLKRLFNNQSNFYPFGLTPPKYVASSNKKN